ncbi:MAG: phosphatase PAP2 family protein [Coriobacteriales bacterium]
MAILVWGNKAETYLFYLLYPLLLVLAWVFEPSYLPRAIAVPALAFVLVSVFRRLYNAKRPYEQLDIEPLIPKSTKGKSFPSRHVFSVYMIAMAWLPFNTVAGVLLLLLGIDMMFMRVLGGVHYPQDVLAGAACGILAGIVGFYIVP